MNDSKYFNINHLKQNMGHKAVRGGVVLLLGQIIQFFLSMGSTIILARILVPGDFGLIAMVLPIIGFIGFFRDSGLQMATIQQETINHKQISTLFWLNVGMGFLLMLVLGLASSAVALFFGRQELILITLAYAINMLIGSFSIQHAALLRRQLAYKQLVYISVIAQLVSISVGVVNALNGMGYWALVYMTLAATIMEVILTWIFCRWLPGLPKRGSGIKKMLAFGAGLTISNLFNLLTQYVDNILIGRFLGGVQLGQYDRAKQLYLMPINQLQGPFNNVAISTLSRLVDVPDQYRKSYLRVQEKLLIVTAAFSGYLIVYGEMLINVLLGSKWSLAGTVLQIFAISGLIIPVSTSVAWLLTTQGRSSDLACWSPFSFLFRCTAILVGYSSGMLGIALSIVSFQYISFIVFSIWVGRKGPVSTLMIWKNMLPTIVASLIGVGIIYYTKLALTEYSQLISLSIGAITFYTIYFAILWLIPSGKASLLDIRNLTQMALKKV